MTETTTAIHHECKQLDDLKLAELVADKYLHLYVPTGVGVEDESHKYWLNYWANLLSQDSLRHRDILMQLDKFGTRITPERVDWEE